MKKLLKICLASFCCSYFISPTYAEEIDTFVPVQDLIVNQWQQKKLKYLAETYQCLDPISYQQLPSDRYGFAMELNNCLEKIENLSFEDIQITERLQQDFALELLDLQQKITQLNTRVTKLEARQFSVTTKLTGEVLYQFSDSFTKQDQSQLAWGYRSRINFNTSFTGKDLLRIRLEAIDMARLDRVTDTNLTRLSVDGSSEGKFEVEAIYEFSWGDRTEIVISPEGISVSDVADVLNPLSSSSRGSISRFGKRDPATLRGPGGSGLGLKYELNKNLRLNLAYVVASDDAADPDWGLFNSSYSAMVQLVINPNDNLAVALTYTHAYERQDQVNLMDSTGSAIANQPFGNQATNSDRLGLQINWRATDNLEIGGWVGVAQAYQQSNKDEQATILNGAFTLVFPDLGAENNLGGIIIGIPPLVTNHTDADLISPLTTFHLETLYRIQVDEHLEITPGLLILINPDTPNGNSIWIGTIRTRFHF